MLSYVTTVEKDFKKDFGTIYHLKITDQIRSETTIFYSSPDFDAIKDLQKRLQQIFRIR